MPSSLRDDALQDTDRREQEMRELPGQINSSAITEKIAIDAAL